MNYPINKVTLGIGRIESQRELHAEDIDVALLQTARALLSELRSSAQAPSPALPIPGASHAKIALGLPPVEASDQERQLVKDLWRTHNPDADPANYEADNLRTLATTQRGLFRLIMPVATQMAVPVKLQQQRGLFRWITPREQTEGKRQAEHVRLYVVLPENGPEDESAAYGKVTGLVAGSFVHRQDLSEAERESLAGEVGAVVKQILSLRPCFITPPPPPVEADSVFGDHFAIALLLSDTPSSKPM